MTPTNDSSKFVSARLPFESTKERLFDFVRFLEKIAKRKKIGVYKRIDLETGETISGPDFLKWWSVQNVWEGCLGTVMKKPVYEKRFFDDAGFKSAFERFGQEVPGTSWSLCAKECNFIGTMSLEIQRLGSMGNIIVVCPEYDETDFAANATTYAIMERMNYDSSFHMEKIIRDDGMIELEVDMNSPKKISNRKITFWPDEPKARQIVVFFVDSERRLPYFAKFRVHWDLQLIENAIKDCLGLVEAKVVETRLWGRVDDGFQPQIEQGSWDVGIWADYLEDFNPYVSNENIPVGSRFPIVYSYSKCEGDFLFLQIDVVHGPEGLFFDFQSAYGAEVLEDLLKEFDIPYELWTGSFESRWGEKFTSFPAASSSTMYFTDNPNAPEIQAKI